MRDLEGRRETSSTARRRARTSTKNAPGDRSAQRSRTHRLHNQKRRPSTEGSGNMGHRENLRTNAHVKVPYIVKIIQALQCGIFSKVLLFAQAQIARQKAIHREDHTGSSMRHLLQGAALRTSPDRQAESD